MAIRATGIIKTLNVDSENCYIRLDYNGEKPKDEYFTLSKNHKNYNSLYSLALVAAVNRYDLQIRTLEEIDSSKNADVLYMVVDW